MRGFWWVLGKAGGLSSARRRAEGEGSPMGTALAPAPGRQRHPGGTSAAMGPWPGPSSSRAPSPSFRKTSLFLLRRFPLLYLDVVVCLGLLFAWFRAEGGDFSVGSPSEILDPSDSAQIIFLQDFRDTLHCFQSALVYLSSSLRLQGAHLGPLGLPCSGRSAVLVPNYRSNIYSWEAWAVPDLQDLQALAGCCFL